MFSILLLVASFTGGNIDSAVLVADVAPLTQTGTNPPSPQRKGSGVEGTVDRGPIKPVGKPGDPNTAPVVGVEIIVRDKNTGKEVLRTKTDKDGKYELKLKAGQYTVEGPKSGIPPRTIKQDIEVKKDQWLKLDIHVDSGIR